MLIADGLAPSAEGGSADVSEEWSARGPRRARRFDDEPAPDGMRLIRVLRLRESEVTEDESESAGPVLWSWYERPRGGDDEGSRAARKPVRLDVHSGDVERCARRIVEGLPLDPGIRRAVILAAKHHDDGKRRRLWQLSIGNSDSDLILAKGGGRMRPRELTAYRHELGSLIEAENDPALLEGLEPDERELALHLIAAHHGRARPYFPADELFDPEARAVDLDEVGARVLVRFARLQRRFGRWGLAYLESLVRAADYAASAAPSEEIEL